MVLQVLSYIDLGPDRLQQQRIGGMITLKNKRREKPPNPITEYELHGNHLSYGAYVGGNTSES